MVVYDNDKRYIVPFDILSDVLTEEQITKLKAKVKKELRKL